MGATVSKLFRKKRGNAFEKLNSDEKTKEAKPKQSTKIRENSRRHKPGIAFYTPLYESPGDYKKKTKFAELKYKDCLSSSFTQKEREIMSDVISDQDPYSNRRRHMAADGIPPLKLDRRTRRTRLEDTHSDREERDRRWAVE